MTLPLDPIIFNICLFELGTISCFGHLPLGKDDQMQNMPSERAFEMVDRDMPVTVDGKPDNSNQTRALVIACNGSSSPSRLDSWISLTIF